MDLKKRAKQLKTDIPALYLALRHRETPLAAKLCAGVTVAYALSPIDLIPDFIPLLGYLDDLIILPAMIALTVKLIPNEIMNNCRQEAKNRRSDGNSKKWRYALPILLIWLLFLVWITAKFLPGAIPLLS
ncbi:YkvA family protein [Caproicibacter sp.]|uniref:YkvA family protein n=1 Tax=Caproicibacter sp. TaxID=2814884 RepID=UPI0039891FF7